VTSASLLDEGRHRVEHAGLPESLDSGMRGAGAGQEGLDRGLHLGGAQSGLAADREHGGQGDDPGTAAGDLTTSRRATGSPNARRIAGSTSPSGCSGLAAARRATVRRPLIMWRVPYPRVKNARR
jgi:hypothetical protein